MIFCMTEQLLLGLKDGDTVVRWSAAKGYVSQLIKLSINKLINQPTNESMNQSVVKINQSITNRSTSR